MNLIDAFIESYSRLQDLDYDYDVRKMQRRVSPLKVEFNDIINRNIISIFDMGDSPYFDFAFSDEAPWELTDDYVVIGNTPDGWVCIDLASSEIVVIFSDDLDSPVYFCAPDAKSFLETLIYYEDYLIKLHSFYPTITDEQRDSIGHLWLDKLKLDNKYLPYWKVAVSLD